MSELARGYRLLLWIFPASFREEYADASLDLVRNRWRDEIGSFRKLRLCCDLLLDLCVSVPRLHWAAMRNTGLQNRTHTAPTYILLYGNRVRLEALLFVALLFTSLLAFAPKLSWSAQVIKPALFGWAVWRLSGRITQLARPFGK